MCIEAIPRIHQIPNYDDASRIKILTPARLGRLMLQKTYNYQMHPPSLAGLTASRCIYLPAAPGSA
jgi:hypothetical protein